MGRTWLHHTLIIWCICGAFAVAAAFVPNAYYQLILTNIAIWATLATAWNLFSGYTGLISFGHAAFFGLGAFTVTIAFVRFGISPWFGIPLASVMGAAAALLIGIPTFRLRGHYFALAMIAYPLAMMYVFNWLGYQEVTLPMKREDPLLYMQFSNPYYYTLLAIVLLVVSLMTVTAVDVSRFGLILRGIKQDELAAQATGINPIIWKSLALILSGAMAAAAGGLYVVVLNLITPNEVFSLFVSANPLVLSMFGGLGSPWGPVIGAVTLVPLSETLHAELGSVLPGIQGVIYGLSIILVILWLPEGVYWHARSFFERSKKAAVANTGVEQPDLPICRAYQKKEDCAAVALRLENVSCNFSGLRALSNVSLEIRSGLVTGIIGPNGAGKTTLFNAINGFVKTAGGKIEFFDRDISALLTYERARIGMARTFQTPRVFSELRVFDNVLLGAVGLNQETSAAQESARWALKQTGLSNLAEVSAGSLQACQVRLLEIARAIAGRPKLLLLDETLAGLAAAEIPMILDTIRRLTRQGITIVIIEHTMSALLQVVDDLKVLDRGAMVCAGEPRTVLKDTRVIEAYLGKRWAERA